MPTGSSTEIDIDRAEISIYNGEQIIREISLYLRYETLG